MDFTETNNLLFAPIIQEVLPRVSNSLPVGRSGHCCCTDGNYIYVYGGYNPKPRLSPDVRADDQPTGLVVLPNREVLVELWLFHIASKTWILGKSPHENSHTPDAAASSCMVRYGKHLLFLWGSVCAFGGLMNNSLQACALNNLSWSVVDSGGLHVDYPQSMAVVQNEMLYLFGGSVNLSMSPVSDLHCINLRSDSRLKRWERLSPGGEVPSGQCKHEMLEYNNRLYLFGGDQVSNTDGLDKIHVYDITQNTWTLQDTTADKKNGFPKTRKFFGCAQQDNIVIICGGEHHQNEALDDVWTLDLKELKWRRLNCRLPKPVYSHGVALTKLGKLYIYGGIVEEDERSSQLFSVQLFFPKLSELCWEVLNNRFPDLHKNPKSELLQIGIPKSFLDRLYS